MSQTQSQLPQTHGVARSLKVGLCVVVGVVLVFLGQAPLYANTVGQCLDLGALLGPTEQGHLQAEQLILLNHPSKDAICVEMGWDCASISVANVQASLFQETQPDVDPLPDCIEDETQGRCLDAGGDLIPESTSEELFADDEPSIPVSNMLEACLNFPSRCVAVPPPEMPTSITVSTVPSTATHRGVPTIPPVVGVDVIHFSHLGLGPATGVSAEIDYPPRHI